MSKLKKTAVYVIYLFEKQKNYLSTQMCIITLYSLWLFLNINPNQQ